MSVVDNDPRILSALAEMQKAYEGLDAAEVAEAVLRTDANDALDDIDKLVGAATSGSDRGAWDSDLLTFGLAVGYELGRGDEMATKADLLGRMHKIAGLKLYGAKATLGAVFEIADDAIRDHTPRVPE